MRQFITIATNAFMELVRQPIFLLLTTGSSLFIVFLAAVPYFGMGEDTKLVKDSALALMLMIGLFVAVLSASASVAHEIRTGTALAVLSKPSDGSAGIAVEHGTGAAFAEAISALLAGDRGAQRQAARTRAEASDWERVLPELLGHYQRLLGREPSAALSAPARPLETSTLPPGR